MSRHLVPKVRRLAEDCLELHLPGNADGAIEIAWLQDAAAIATDQGQHLLLNFHGRSYLDSTLVEAVGEERERFPPPGWT